jgi:exopolysaccharide biosynthesis polyprenyl glycosylphosphotransferase
MTLDQRKTSMETYLTLNDPRGHSIETENNGGDDHRNTQQPVQETLAEKKVAQMLARLGNQEFDNTREIQRLRLSLLFWVIHEKIGDRLKRLFDITISSFTLFLVWPFMAVTAIAIKLDSQGPIIFRQERVGKWGKKFYCLKFRSMYQDAEARKAELIAMNEADEIVFKIKEDPRITRVGKIIRKLSIDELPQLINVIKGDMSIVGPRPPLPSEVANYEFEHLNRLNAVPGITGLQQVSGRSTLEFRRWVELDVQYIREQSLWKDIKIMLKTIPVVLIGRGAY